MISKTKMKKILLALGLVGFITIAMSSCKMHEDCPAYGSVAVETENNG
jgi:hypothetical protein